MIPQDMAVMEFVCSKCGRQFKKILPHRCLTGFQKIHLKFKRIIRGDYNGVTYMGTTDENILELLKLIPKEEQQGILVSVHYSIDGYCTACATKGFDRIYESGYMPKGQALLCCIDKALEYLKEIYDKNAVSTLEKVCEKDYRV